MLKNFLISLLLVTVAGISMVPIIKLPHAKSGAPLPLVAQPDAFMETVAATVLDKQGHPILKIETSQMRHYANQDKTDIVTPHVTIFRHSPHPWYIDSKHAIATNGIAQIVFQDNVVIQHSQEDINPVTVIKTSSLTIFPNQQIAKTADTITLTQPNIVLHAIGMLANFTDGTVKLLSNATGEYMLSS